jgi:hypothetical protein
MTAWQSFTTFAVEAPLNFLRPMEGRPVAYQFEPPPGVPVRTGDYDPHEVLITDARPFADTLLLDIEGFALLQAPGTLSDYGDDEAIRADYYPEVERLIASATGAALVIPFDHNVRNAARAAAGEPGIRGPVDRTHNDFTDRSGRERARRELEARGHHTETWPAHRFAIVNLWRPIGRPVEKSPLALCDATTIRPEDLIASDLVYRDRVGETYALGFHPGQRWYYFPRLTPDEAILIKGYDSREDGVARFTAHSAFDDPASPPGAPERESIETRALVFYPEPVS